MLSEVGDNDVREREDEEAVLVGRLEVEESESVLVAVEIEVDKLRELIDDEVESWVV